MTHLAHAPSLRQPADLLDLDMATALAKLERAEDKLMRAQSRKRRVIIQKQVNVMADKYEALKEQRNRMEASYE